MSFEFKIRLDLKESFDNLAKRLAIKKEIFERIFAEDVRRRFESSPPTTQGGNVYGEVYWRKLSDSYLLRRPDRRLGKVLVDSGRLKSSFVVGSSEMISRFDDQYTYTFGTKVPYAEKLQETWPIVLIHPNLLEKLAKAYVDWIVKPE